MRGLRLQLPPTDRVAAHRRRNRRLRHQRRLVRGRRGKSLRFEIPRGRRRPAAAGPGSAAREDNGVTDVNLVKPGKEKIAIGRDVLFPTQHLARIISTAKDGRARVRSARVRRSDTGKKVYSTLAIIGLQRKGESPDSAVAGKLADMVRWPVTISYFNEANKDSAPDYTMSFDLYENGVSGSLKLDYGSFALERQAEETRLAAGADLRA